ncbi:MAG: SDR family NAD(P)-dependent oxidoreductase [Anaerolineae bacterium]|jgi:dihydroflavonol-4-reductase|nr:SDR family NAD(P)-dependent oxidoreductase [Anaerolineae bacterium]
MKVLITGATGFIGKATVSALISRGHTVRCFVRESSDTSSLEETENVTIFTGSLFNDQDLRNAMNDCDALVHLASVYSFWESSPASYDEVNINGTIQVMRAASHSFLRHIVHISSAVVYGDATPQPYNELTQYGKERFSQYADSKFYGEKFAEKFMDEEGLPLTILQPVSVIGSGDTKSSGRQIQNYIRRVYPARAFLDAKITYVSVNDVADAIVRTLENPKTIGQRYIIGKEAITNHQYLKKIEEVSGVKLPKLVLPDWAALFIAQAITIRANRTGNPPLWGFTIDMAKTFQAGFEADGSRAEKELGLVYTPVMETLEESIRWHMAQNPKRKSSS